MTYKNKDDQYFILTYPEYTFAISRFRDYIQRVLHNHKIVETRFLNKIEQEILTKMVNTQLALVFDGGFENAIYQKAILIPNAFQMQCKPEVVLLQTEFNSKYHTIEHKHVLGTLISMGIQREFMGDILVLDNKICIACDKTVVPLIKSIDKIYRAKVVFEEVETVCDVTHQKITFEKIIASFRLDSVVSALANISRSKAVELITKGDVRVNYSVCLEKSKCCEMNDEIIVRRYGKFQIAQIHKQTKKNNFVVSFNKFV